MNLNSNQSNGNKKFFAKFIGHISDQKEKICLEGQNAKTLIALKEAGVKGITTFQSGELKLLRLSSYVHILRHKYGIDILTNREGNSRTARYTLMDRIEIID